MFKTEKKEVKEFKKLIKEANSLVKKNNFESALSLYSKIIKYKDVDESLKKDLSKLQDSLILYLKMNEAYVLAKDANFKMLKKVLDSVAELKARIKEESPEMKNMVNYIADHHNFVTNYYDSYFGGFGSGQKFPHHPPFLLLSWLLLWLLLFSLSF